MMKFGNFFYRQRQRLRYHCTQIPFDRKVAEINRNGPVIVTRGEFFEVLGFDLLLSRKYHSFIVDRLHLFKKLLNTPGIKFRLLDTQLVLDFEGTALRITTAEELFIFKEIFIEGCYRIFAPTPFNVIDIGMNVGFASLFFASQLNVEEVYGYEPFRRTYDEAMSNLKLNPGPALRIHAHNFGLSYQTEKRTVHYSADQKGKNSIVGGPGDEEIQTKDVAEVLDELLDADQTGQYFVKVDCEGAEYEIFGRLGEQRISKQIFGFVIEWHGGRPTDIIDTLVANDFRVQARGEEGIGLITAFR